MRPVAVMALMVGALFGLIVGGALWFVSRGAQADEDPAEAESAQSGFGAGSWLVKAIDATVGLPKQERAYAAYAIFARRSAAARGRFPKWPSPGRTSASLSGCV